MKKIVSLCLLILTSFTTLLFTQVKEAHATTVTNLTGYTWVGNTNPFIENYNDETFNLDFTAQEWNNDIRTYDKFRLYGETVDTYVFYEISSPYYQYSAYYSDGGGWSTNSRTINILGGTDATNASTISWFQSNGILTPPPVEPSLSGNFDEVTLNIGTTFNVAEFISSLTIENGNGLSTVSNIFVVSNNYISDVVGDYEIVLELRDGSTVYGQYTKEIIVRPVDNEKPTLTGDFSTLYISTLEQFNPMVFIDTLVISDNIDTLTWEDVKMIDFNYRYNTPGVFPLVLEVTDKSGNKQQYTKVIVVYEVAKPYLSGNFEPIIISTQSTFNVNAYINSLTIVNNNGLSLQDDVIISVNTYEPGIPGTFTIVFELRDITTLYPVLYTKQIIVEDAVTPTLVGNFEPITLNTSTVFDVSNFINGLSIQNNNKGLTLVHNLVVVSHDYISNIPGTYELVLELKKDAVSFGTYRKMITVIHETPTQPPVTETPDEVVDNNLSAYFLPGAIILIIAMVILPKRKY